jgi:hypothetical protein
LFADAGSGLLLFPRDQAGFLGHHTLQDCPASSHADYYVAFAKQFLPDRRR